MPRQDLHGNDRFDLAGCARDERRRLGHADDGDDDGDDEAELTEDELEEREMRAEWDEMIEERYSQP